MEGTLKLWLAILAVGALNYLSRLSFIALFACVEMPAIIQRALRFVPAAIVRERERFTACATRTTGGNLLGDLVQ